MSAPTPPSDATPALKQYLVSLSQWIIQQTRGSVKQDTAIGSILLITPNKSVYSLSVEDDGSVITTLVQG